jgi:hypothetical protein
VFGEVEDPFESAAGAFALASRQQRVASIHDYGPRERDRPVDSISVRAPTSMGWHLP